MNKTKLYGGAGLLVVVILIGWFALGHSHTAPVPVPAPAATPVVPVDVAASPETIEAMKKAGPLAGSPLYGVHVLELPSAGVSFTCAQAGELRQRAAAVPNGGHSDEALPTGLFWQSESSPAQFIYYENQNRLLVVCDGRTVASAFLKDNGLGPREELVKFDRPHFGDWARDGKFEFTIFRGQCVEGPCVGLFHVLQIDGTKIRQLAEINADGVETEQMSIGGVSRTSLHVQATCYSMDYDPVFDYVAVLDFGGPNVLALVPPQQIRVRSPELLQRLSSPPALNPDASATQQSLSQLQPLIYEAYQGRSLTDLKQQYAKILASIPGLRVGDPAPVQCDPLAILTMISEGK